MLAQRLKERIVKRSIFCICKTNLNISIFQPSENLLKFFIRANYGGSRMDTGYNRMSNTFKKFHVNSQRSIALRDLNEKRSVTSRYHCLQDTRSPALRSVFLQPRTYVYFSNSSASLTKSRWLRAWIHSNTLWSYIAKFHNKSKIFNSSLI